MSIICRNCTKCTKLFGYSYGTLRINVTSCRIVTLTIFIISWLILMREILLFDKVIPALMSNESRSNSSACHMTHIYNTETSVQRCYPLLINFASRCCKRSQQSNCLTGLKNGAQQCLMLNKRVFDTDLRFVDRNKNILRRRRGAGYWLWKPYIIYRELYGARDGDIIIYSDAGVDVVADISHLTNLTSKQDIIVFELRGWHVRQIHSHFRKIDRRLLVVESGGFIVFNGTLPSQRSTEKTTFFSVLLCLGGSIMSICSICCFHFVCLILDELLSEMKEMPWVKRDTLILLDVDKPEYLITRSGLASYMVVKKSSTSMLFVTEWLTYAQDSRAITDDANVLGSPNYPSFQDHRHDQSILSLLAKKWNFTLYPDPSQYGAGEQRTYPTIFEHHRSRGLLYI